jgi:protease I
MARVAILLDEMFEDSEFRVPYDRLKGAGHQVDIIGVEAGKKLEGKQGKQTARTDKAASEVTARDYDALVIPGGYSPDHLRTHEDAVRLTRELFAAHKPIAAVCHAGSMLIEADLVRDRTVTSWPSIKTDLVNAGAKWVDREVVEDDNLITSRKPDDLDAFSSALLKQLERATERPQAAPRA